MRFAPNDILIFKLFTFCVYKTDSTKPFMVMLIIHIEKAEALQAGKAPAILNRNRLGRLKMQMLKDFQANREKSKELLFQLKRVAIGLKQKQDVMVGLQKNANIPIMAIQKPILIRMIILSVGRRMESLSGVMKLITLVKRPPHLNILKLQERAK